MKESRKKLLISIGFLLAFVAWTVALKFFDVKAIGPEGSCVGFAKMNESIHELFGVNMTLYIVTDWLGLVPIISVICFAVFGLVQFIRRRNVFKVDRDILALGVFYLAVMAVFLTFEKLDINYRPILIKGVLEASYPSSTTMLAMCVMPTVAMQIDKRIKNVFIRNILQTLIYVFIAFMVAARLVSGVHWFSDIIGGILVSIGLVMMYSCFLKTKG